MMSGSHDRRQSPTGHAPAGVTRLLSAWREGDVHALDRLTPLVYDELRDLARRHMRRERPNHTLQATAVVHEAFVRMVGMNVPWQDRGHFYAVASRLMRRILVDHAKARHRNKRGGPVTIQSVDVYDADTDNVPATAGDIDVLEIDEALERLAEQDQRLAHAVELHYFGGLTYIETARALGISEATVHRDLRLAKAWILAQVASTSPKRIRNVRTSSRKPEGGHRGDLSAFELPAADMPATSESSPTNGPVDPDP